MSLPISSPSHKATYSFFSELQGIQLMCAHLSVESGQVHFLLCRGNPNEFLALPWECTYVTMSLNSQPYPSSLPTNPGWSCAPHSYLWAQSFRVLTQVILYLPTPRYSVNLPSPFLLCTPSDLGTVTSSPSLSRPACAKWGLYVSTGQFSLGELKISVF